MSVTIIAIGKKHESWVQEGIERYQKRLRTPFSVEWVLLPHSSLEGDRARQEESQRILSRLKSTDTTVLLDERGKAFSSPDVAQILNSSFVDAKSVTLIIGGAYGVSPEVREQADLVWSLSPLVFPHQLVRLVVIEQLYRAQEIAKGGSYHHV